MSARQKGKIDEKAKTHLRDLLKYWKPLVLLMGLVVTLNIANYTLLAYMPTYLESEIGLTSRASLILIIIGQTAMMLVIPFSGALSDRVGRKTMWWISIVGSVRARDPAVQADGYRVSRAAIFAFAVLGLLYVPQLSTISAMFPAMFPTHVRYAGFAIAYNISTSMFGGTAPAVNQALINSSGDKLMPAYYLMAACVVGRRRAVVRAGDAWLLDPRPWHPGHRHASAARAGDAVGHAFELTSVAASRGSVGRRAINGTAREVSDRQLDSCRATTSSAFAVELHRRSSRRHPLSMAGRSTSRDRVDGRRVGVSGTVRRARRPSSRSGAVPECRAEAARHLGRLRVRTARWPTPFARRPLP